MARKANGTSPTLDHIAGVMIENGGYFNVLDIAKEFDVTKTYAGNILSRLRNRPRYEVTTVKGDLLSIKIESINTDIIATLTHADLARKKAKGRVDDLWGLALMGSRRATQP